MNFYLIEPEVAGGIGPGSNVSTHPIVVHDLDYQFEGWLGDDLLTSFPCFIVTDQLGDVLAQEHFTGAQLAGVKVSISDNYYSSIPRNVIPPFYWLKITGRAGEEDFGYSPDRSLVVSERALDLLRQFSIESAKIEPYQSEVRMAREQVSFPVFKECERPITDADIDGLNAQLGLTLPPDLRQHYLEHNGGSPVPSCIPVGASLYHVATFLPINHSSTPGRTFENYYLHYVVKNGVLPAELAPFAVDAEGNLFCYCVAGSNRPAIYYWRQADYSQPDRGIKYVAASLQDFLNSFVPHPETVQHNIRREWNTFYQRYENPTKAQVLEHAAYLDKKYARERPNQ